MFIYIFALMCFSFIMAIINAVLFGNEKKLTDFGDMIIWLGFAIWGLILVVLNWR